MPAPEATARARAPQSVNTMAVRAGQVGLATSYWLGPAVVEHQVLERRDALGGSRRDR